MKKFMDRDFMLNNEVSKRLYHEVADGLPIIDYHCHLDPKLIAEDARFDNLSQAWLAGDHYKWRALRANGVNEHFVTGNASDREKFMKWAGTVPDTLRNPLYHWTHLELQRYFGIEELLGPDTAEDIYERSNEMLKSPEFSIRALLKKMKVEVLCTTDDPVDSLEHHQKIREDGFATRVLPTWRPDKAMAVEDAAAYSAYLERLEEASGMAIGSYAELLEALGRRHDYFHRLGCRVSDHGLETFVSEDFTEEKAALAFLKVRSGKNLEQEEALLLRSALLHDLAVIDHEKGWAQQFHFGALRNNSSRSFQELGPDTGYDSIGDLPSGKGMSRFFDRLDQEQKLAKTVVYNLNPADNAMVATMVNNFNDGQTVGKMQFGSGWWFLDQKYGMQDQLNTLSSLGLLSRFVGMLTDSRSFLSYPRHEYFRRILCDLVGEDVNKGELPDDAGLLNNLIGNVCYYNAKQYFAL